MEKENSNTASKLHSQKNSRLIDKQGYQDFINKTISVENSRHKNSLSQDYDEGPEPDIISSQFNASI